jgi:mono/diheme cytochrome c family protein
MTPRRCLSLILLFLGLSAIALAASNGAWLRKVPEADRVRTNPYAGNPEAVSAGRLLFAENCAKCHGSNAEGLRGRPSLRSDRVANATDGELAWLLRNGSLAKGMPTWSSLPEPERWQIIAFLRSLHRDSSTQAAAAGHP